MKKISLISAVALTLLLTLIVSGCGGQESPYLTNNEENYTVSVKYDANGGTFTTNTSVIVDSYNIDELEKNGGGEAQIALLSPDDSARGNDAFTAVKNGYFLAGWYKERTEVTTQDGETAYTYSEKWDFSEDVLTVDSAKEYSAEQPVLTLYAAWVPLFEIEFYALDSGELVDSLKFDPTVAKEFTLPEWDKETGAVEMYDFPERTGYTYNKAYYDAQATKLVSGDTLSHPGEINYENGVAKNSVLKLYVDYTQGEWYRIYTAEQFADNAKLDGNYELFADLDFEDEIWPTSFMYGNFSGTVKGNGHTIKNVNLTQTNNSKVNAGLFGNLTEDASITDLILDNITFTVKAGTRVVGTSYGLLAGTLSADAQLENLSIKNSCLQIDSSCYFGVDDYSIGLVCGMGDASAVKQSDIDCKVVGDDTDGIKLTVNGNTVTLEFVK